MRSISLRILFTRWLPIAAAVCVVAAVYMWGLGSYGLIDPDEGRYAEIPREMMESGDFITPRLNYVKYFEKPPLHYWLTALSFAVFGQNEFAARFFPAVLGIAGCLLTFFIAKLLSANTRHAVCSALILACSVLWFAMSRLNITDMTLTFFMTLAMFGYVLWLDKELQSGPEAVLYERRSAAFISKQGRLSLFYAAMALAVLSKGLVGVVLPGGIAFLHLLFTRRWRQLLRLFSPIGIAVFFIIAAPYFILACRANSDYFQFFFIHEHFERFLTKVHGRYEPFWFFIPIIIASVVPWTGMIFDGVRAARGKWGIMPRHAGTLLLLWFAIPFIFFSASSSKLIPYILPCMPPLALMAGAAFEAALSDEDGTRGIVKRFVRISAFVLLPLAAAGLLMPLIRPGDDKLLPYFSAMRTFSLSIAVFWSASFFISRMKDRAGRMLNMLFPLALLMIFCAGFGFEIASHSNSARVTAAQIRELSQRGDTVVVYRELMQGMAFYLKERVVTACELNELKFGAAQESDPRWFLDKVQLRRLWNGPTRVLLVSRRRDAVRLAEDIGREPIQLGEANDRILFTNF